MQDGCQSRESELEQIQASILKMGGLVEAAIYDGLQCLVTRDLEAAAVVREGDRAIDALGRHIQCDLPRIVRLCAPCEGDLRLVLAVLRISTSLERIGDYAKNMAKRTSMLAELSPIEGSDAALRRMAREVQNMLRDTLDAFVTHDDGLAQEVLLRDRDVDQMYNALFREFLTHMMEDPRAITACLHLHFIAKNIERMGDLVTDMAEQVIYLVTGQMPDEDRPKGDTTAYLSKLE
ncbi:phosphate signaling complex protein PhoU [Limimaricola cinnabarinus]|uniref:Phosphate-specific transport system accessory protein PhoU n=1 Tax=Limimaricola cinnabarinus TaxID=1125964 RepID=A0A2G1MBQ1_9RHOB|nr:phosphate signaling complex protein PhoU [Limimaricola cinnabarinus]PHP26165.1 phosphate transport system regulatory protein PhoU [Limimaricola cinnabarinus]